MVKTSFRIFIFFCLLLTGLKTFSQSYHIDTLIRAIHRIKPSEIQYQSILKIEPYYQSVNKDSLAAYLVQLHKISKTHSSLKNHENADLIQIEYWIRIGETEKALKWIDSILSHISVKNPSKRELYFKLCAFKADCYGDANNYSESLQQLYSLINQAEFYGDSLVMAKNMSTIGVIQYNLNHISEAFSWYFKSLNYFHNDPQNPLAGVTYINLAETYRWVGKLDSSNYFIQKALPICVHSGNLFFIANAYRVLANIYRDQKEFPMAEKTMMVCIDMVRRIDGDLPLSNEKLALAGIYYKAGDYTKSIAILQNGIKTVEEEEKRNINGNEYELLKISGLETLSKCYSQIGDDKNYENTLLKLLESKDSFYAHNSARELAKLQAQYELEKKESTIAKQNLAITQKNYLFYGSILFLILFSIVIYLTFKNYQRKEKLKLQLVLEKEKRSAAQSILEAEEKERSRIAADLHDNIGAFATAIRANVEKIMDSGMIKSTADLLNLQQNSIEINNSLRDTIWVLNKENIGLVEISDRIKNYIQKLKPSYEKVEFSILEEIEKDIALSSKTALNLFRIIQESIHNALKHSMANQIEIRFISKEKLNILIQDNGIGMDIQETKNSGHGIRNIQERAKEIGFKYELISGKGMGTLWKLESTIN